MSEPGRASGSRSAVAWVRAAALAAGLGAAVLSAGFLLGWPIATGMWPVSVTPITYTFLSAYVLGSVAALMWVAVTGEIAALRGIGLTTAVAYGSMAVLLVGMLGGRPEVVINVVAAIGLCLGGILALVFGLRQPVRDRRLTPGQLRVACLVVAVLLLILGVPLLLWMPDVMPWTLDLDSGALIGCLFLGSAAYFAYGALRPAWPNAAGPLAALLAYDVVLTPPLVAHSDRAAATRDRPRPVHRGSRLDRGHGRLRLPGRQTHARGDHVRTVTTRVNVV